MLNPHCEICKNKTKLYIKLPGRNKYTYICKNALTCPFTEKKEGEETKLVIEE
jgi:hypothetical protein